MKSADSEFDNLQDYDNLDQDEENLQIQPSAKEHIELDNISQLDTKTLDADAIKLLDKLIHETDLEKTRDLTYLFNINQNKKTAVRLDKMSKLLDALTDQTMLRLTSRPNEISNQELLAGLKVVQDLLERSQKQLQNDQEISIAPLIQVNQQNNEVHIGDSASTLNRESREKVKNAVLSILQGLNANENTSLADIETTAEEKEIIDMKDNITGE